MQIKNIAIAGTGVMGASIAHVFASHGFQVNVWGRLDGSLAAGRKRIEQTQKILVAQGVLTQEKSNNLLRNITFTTSLDCMEKADLVCESIAEDLEQKQKFFTSINHLIKNDAIITTNTSGLSINAIASAVNDTSRFSGLHWINPAHLIPLVEIIPSTETTDAVVDTLQQLLQLCNKKSTLVKKDIPGFILNRLQCALIREALHLLQTGAASKEDLDTTVKHGLGLRYATVGPIETMDLGGLDTFNYLCSYLFPDLSNSNQGSNLLQSLVEQGHLGVKSGAGFYDYSGDKAFTAVKSRDEKVNKILKLLYEG